MLIAQAFCAFIFLVSALTLIEYFFNINLKASGEVNSIFEVMNKFVNEPLSSVQAFLSSGHMSPFSATNFILIGFTLFFLDNKLISYYVHQFFMLIVILIAFSELLDNMFGISSNIEYFGVSYIQIGIPLALLFLVWPLGYCSQDRVVESLRFS